MPSPGDVWGVLDFVSFLTGELFSRAVSSMSIAGILRKHLLRTSGTVRTPFYRCAISIILKENAENVNSGRCAAAAGQGRMKRPVIFWLKNPSVITSRIQGTNKTLWFPPLKPRIEPFSKICSDGIDLGHNFYKPEGSSVSIGKLSEQIKAR